MTGRLSRKEHFTDITENGKMPEGPKRLLRKLYPQSEKKTLVPQNGDRHDVASRDDQGRPLGVIRSN